MNKQDMLAEVFNALQKNVELNEKVQTTLDTVKPIAEEYTKLRRIGSAIAPGLLDIVDELYDNYSDDNSPIVWMTSSDILKGYVEKPSSKLKQRFARVLSELCRVNNQKVVIHNDIFKTGLKQYIYNQREHGYFFNAAYETAKQNALYVSTRLNNKNIYDIVAESDLDDYGNQLVYDDLVEAIIQAIANKELSPNVQPDSNIGRFIPTEELQGFIIDWWMVNVEKFEPGFDSIEISNVIEFKKSSSYDKYNFIKKAA